MLHSPLVRRAVLVLVVALLTLGVSGLSSLVVAEPCTTANSANHEDAACPPMCVTCGCCAQAAEPASLTVACSPLERVTDIVAPWPRLPRTLPRDILHVPKLARA